MLLVVVLQLPLAVCTLFLSALKSCMILYRLCFFFFLLYKYIYIYIYTYIYVVRNLALQLSSIFESEGILHGVEALASFLTLNGLNLARSRGEYAIISYFGLLVKL